MSAYLIELKNLNMKTLITLVYNMLISVWTSLLNQNLVSSNKQVA